MTFQHIISDYARARETAEARREWIGETQWSVEELVAEQERLRRECAERHPEWFERSAA